MTTMFWINLICMCFGFRVQAPVRRIKRGRSFKYKFINKSLSHLMNTKKGKRGRKTFKKHVSRRRR